MASGQKVPPRTWPAGGGQAAAGGGGGLWAGGPRRPWLSWPLPLLPRNKFVEFDMKPVCKRCYEKFPLELKKRLKKLSELAARRAQPKSAGLQPA